MVEVGAIDGVIAHHVDVRDPKRVTAFAAAVPTLMSSSTMSVTTGHPSGSLKVDPTWQAMYEVNLLHLFAVTHAFLPRMIDAGRGSIVNLHSVEGMRGIGEPVYAAMKAGAAHFTTSLAAGVGRHGIRVNGVGPDLTQTPQVDYLRRPEDADSSAWRDWAPVGRVGWPAETARTILFLASDLSRHHRPQHPGRWRQPRPVGLDLSSSAGRFVNRPTTQ